MGIYKPEQINGLNCVLGCKPSGIDRSECKNCSALVAAVRLSNQRKIYRKVLAVDNNGSIIRKWNGKVLLDRVNMLAKLRNPKHGTYMVDYSGDVSCAQLNIIEEVFDIMWKHPQTNFIVITKRPDILLRKLNEVGVESWPLHVKAAVSVSSHRTTWRLDVLRKFKCSQKEVWIKPLVSDVLPIDLSSISYVRISEETGSGAREMPLQTLFSLIRECRSQEVDFGVEKMNNKTERKEMNTAEIEKLCEEAMRIAKLHNEGSLWSMASELMQNMIDSRSLEKEGNNSKPIDSKSLPIATRADDFYDLSHADVNEIICKILASAERPLKKSEIGKLLKSHGYNRDDRHQSTKLSNCLNKGSKAGLFTRIGIKKGTKYIASCQS